MNSADCEYQWNNTAQISESWLANNLQETQLTDENELEENIDSIYELLK